MTRIGLATTHHDPDGRLNEQIQRLLPIIQELYGSVVVRVTSESDLQSIEALRSAGAHVTLGSADKSGLRELGLVRRQVVADTLGTDCTYIHLCDFDRVLHWIEFHGAELKAVLDWLPTYDFVVLGRTRQAFQSHPRVQRDTERIINFAYAQQSGDSWDVTAASRGISRRAAELLIAQSKDDTIGNDCTWPILLHSIPGMTLGYWPTKGLEYETADRYADEVAAAGGVEAWKARIDSDLHAWELRLELARIEIAAMRDHAT